MAPTTLVITLALVVLVALFWFIMRRDSKRWELLRSRERAPEAARTLEEQEQIARDEAEHEARMKVWEAMRLERAEYDARVYDARETENRLGARRRARMAHPSRLATGKFGGR